MVEPFLGQIVAFGFNFAPREHAFCNGQILPISQNTALFSLLGTQFGGNGVSTFALPNLQGCATVNAGQGPGLSQYSVGQTAGSETVTLTTAEMPQHTHTFDPSAMSGTLQCHNGAGNSRDAAGNVPAIESAGVTAGYADNTPLNATMKSDALAVTGTLSLAAAGGNQPHSNMQPYLVLNFCIALSGVFPVRS
jgi:microcystin-dependent protein